MATLVASGAQLSCDQGSAPSNLVVPPRTRADAGGARLATVDDHLPNANIIPFGMCRSLANPHVQAATSSARVFTPMPCLPVTPSPWSPGSTASDIGGRALLTSDSACLCQWGGIITVERAATEAATGR